MKQFRYFVTDVFAQSALHKKTKKFKIFYLRLDTLERGLYPSWDAANQESVALAEKLGYHLDHAYEVYIIQLDAK